MKKILFAAVAALAITGCSQNEEIDRAADKAEISFNTAVSKTTRAATIANADFKEFSVYAYSHDNAFATATTIKPLVTGAQFKLESSSWTTTNTIYWPATDKVSFFAFSPNSAVSEANWTAATAAVAPKLTYTVESAVKDQKDLVLAEVINKEKASPATAVSLTFKHALTKIGFKVKGIGDGVTYTVNKIVINAMNKGVYTYAGTSTGVTTLGTWDIPSDVTTTTAFTIQPASPLEITGTDSGTTTTDDLIGNSDYIAMLIPQKLLNVSIEVYYKAEIVDSTNGNTLLCDKTTTPETITFVEADGSWAAGQHIAYTLKLQGAEKMKIEGSLTDDWSSFDDGGELPKTVN